MDKGIFRKSDFIDGAIFREIGDFTEAYEVIVEPGCDHACSCFVAHGLLSIEDVDLRELAAGFDCASVSELKDELGADWKQKAILSWFDMACKNDPAMYRVRQEPFLSCEEAYQWMYRLSGYQDDGEEPGKEDQGLEISRILTISTSHISHLTAARMDIEEIQMGFYAAGESGYIIQTVGWENYSNDMPEDLYACVKFAAEHGCDWLCLDGDAVTVPDLPVYRWD